MVSFRWKLYLWGQSAFGKEKKKRKFVVSQPYWSQKKKISTGFTNIVSSNTCSLRTLKIGPYLAYEKKNFSCADWKGALMVIKATEVTSWIWLNTQATRQRLSSELWCLHSCENLRDILLRVSRFYCFFFSCNGQVCFFLLKNRETHQISIMIWVNQHLIF